MRSDVEFLLYFAGFFSLSGFILGAAMKQKITSVKLSRAFDEGRRAGVAEAAIYMQPTTKLLQRIK